MSVSAIKREYAWLWIVPASLLIVGVIQESRGAVALLIGAVAALSLSGSV
jgi:hypothetical protein